MKNILNVSHCKIILLYPVFDEQMLYIYQHNIEHVEYENESILTRKPHNVIGRYPFKAIQCYCAIHKLTTYCSVVKARRVVGVHWIFLGVIAA